MSQDVITIDIVAQTPCFIYFGWIELKLNELKKEILRKNPLTKWATKWWPWTRQTRKQTRPAAAFPCPPAWIAPPPVLSRSTPVPWCSCRCGSCRRSEIRLWGSLCHRKRFHVKSFIKLKKFAPISKCPLKDVDNTK